MRALSSQTRLVAAGIGLIAASNAVVLAGAAWNRSGEPEAVLTLTQRETRFPHDWGLQRENSGLSVELQARILPALPANRRPKLYEVGTYARGDAEWLDSKKLAELGFDLATPPNDRSFERRYRKQLAKPVFLVLEMDGPAYRESLKRIEEFAAGEPKPEVERVLQAEREGSSRLFVVDAGRDGAALRARYPARDRYAIVHGKVWLRDWLAGIGGFVEVLGTDLNVPLQFHSAIARGKSHEMQVAFGRRLEPWISAAPAK